MSITFYEIISNTPLSIKQPQTPELAIDCFRTVMSATWNLNDRTSIMDSPLDGSIYEKNPPNPKKIDTKGFSIDFGTCMHAQ